VRAEIFPPDFVCPEMPLVGFGNPQEVCPTGDKDGVEQGGFSGTVAANDGVEAAVQLERMNGALIFAFGDTYIQALV